MGLQTEGTVDELRARLIQNLRATASGISREEKEHPVMDPKSHGGARAVKEDTDTRPVAATPLSPAELCDKVRKWGIRFDGSGDPLSFLERIEELRECYGFRDSDVLQTLPEMLKGRALLWYRNHKAVWRTWNEAVQSFHLYFLSHRYKYKLEEEIRNRVQRPRETAAEYVTDILTLMRRYDRMSRTSQLDRIYENRNYWNWQVNTKDYPKPWIKNADSIPVHRGCSL